MASPTRSGVETGDTSSSTNMTVAYPSTNSGDLLILIVGARAASITTDLSADGWTHLGKSGATTTITDMSAWWKEAAGTETGDQTVSFSTSCNASGAMYCFSSTEDPDTTPPQVAWDFDDFDSTTKTCAALDPGWGTSTTYWIRAFFHRTSGAIDTITAWPYADNRIKAGGTGVSNLSGYCDETGETDSNDEGSFTTSTTADWSSVTVAIPPIGAGGAGGATQATHKRHWSNPHYRFIGR